MSLLVVGSMAFDSIKSPFGEVERVIGGSATYFSLAASYLTPVRLVSVVGKDVPKETLDMLSARGIDLQGLLEKMGPKRGRTRKVKVPEALGLSRNAWSKSAMARSRSPFRR